MVLILKQCYKLRKIDPPIPRWGGGGGGGGGGEQDDPPWTASPLGK